MLQTVVIFIVGQVVPLQVDDIYVYSSLTLVAFFQLFPFEMCELKESIIIIHVFKFVYFWRHTFFFRLENGSER